MVGKNALNTASKEGTQSHTFRPSAINEQNNMKYSFITELEICNFV